MNRWDIPVWLEKEIRGRDNTCVYCGVQMVEKGPQGGSRRAVATWEHIINDATIVTRENIARCCAACNSSKGTKDLIYWLQSDYCTTHGITENTVAKVLKDALNEARRLLPKERDENE